MTYQQALRLLRSDAEWHHIQRANSDDPDHSELFERCTDEFCKRRLEAVKVLMEVLP